MSRAHRIEPAKQNLKKKEKITKLKKKKEFKKNPGTDGWTK
jgi:hypothetical protein